MMGGQGGGPSGPGGQGGPMGMPPPGNPFGPPPGMGGGPQHNSGGGPPPLMQVILLHIYTNHIREYVWCVVILV